MWNPARGGGGDYYWKIPGIQLVKYLFLEPCLANMLSLTHPSHLAANQVCRKSPLDKIIDVIALLPAGSLSKFLHSPIIYSMRKIM
jgi:hypothetical protein